VPDWQTSTLRDRGRCLAVPRPRQPLGSARNWAEFEESRRACEVVGRTGRCACTWKRKSSSSTGGPTAAIELDQCSGQAVVALGRSPHGGFCFQASRLCRKLLPDPQAKWIAEPCAVVGHASYYGRRALAADAPAAAAPASAYRRHQRYAPPPDVPQRCVLVLLRQLRCEFASHF
jgi:hypothetical protein